MASKKKVAQNVNTEFSSVTLMLPKDLYLEASNIAKNKDEDIGNILSKNAFDILKKYVKENANLENDSKDDGDNLYQYSLFAISDEDDAFTNKPILPSSKDAGASRLLIDDDNEANKITRGQFWVAYEKKLAPYMGDKDSSAKMKQWMGSLIKKHGTVNVMNAMMKLDNLAMMPASPVAWVAKVLTGMSADDAFKRNHGSQRGGGRGNGSGGMVNI